MKKSDIFQLIIITAIIICVVYFKVYLSNQGLIAWSIGVFIITLYQSTSNYFKERRLIKKYYSEHIEKIRGITINLKVLNDE